MPTLSEAQQRMISAAERTPGGSGNAPIGGASQSPRIQAAGVMFMAPSGLVLWVRGRGKNGFEGEWCFPGGKLELGETALQAALRECDEEINYVPEGDPVLLHRAITKRGVDYTTFFAPVEGAFPVVLNAENVAWAWAPLGKPPEPMNPGIGELIADVEVAAQNASDDAAGALSTTPNSGIPIGAKRKDAEDAGFNEGDHPRADNGQFGSGGGGGSGSSKIEKGHSVEFERDGKKVSGTVQSVSPSGKLTVKTPNGTMTVNSKDVKNNSSQSAPADKRILAAYSDLPHAEEYGKKREAKGEWNKRVAIADIRAKLADMPRKDLDAALKAMHAKNGFHLSGTDNPRGLTAEQREAAIEHLGEKMYYAWQTRDPSAKDEQAQDRLALDASPENRTYDIDGHLHVASSVVSAAQVNDYRCEEIPGWKELGLAPGRVYALLRDPIELEKAVPTLHGKPLVIVHRAQTADDHDRTITVGTVTNPVWEAPNVNAELTVWDGEAIELIESGEQSDLSCGYFYVPVMESGTYNGVHFDGRMTQIAMNHLAVIPQGRVIGARVGDSITDPWLIIEHAILSLAS